MKLRPLAAISLIVIAAVSACLILGAAPTAPRANTQWEYNSIAGSTNATEELNRLGSEGWELVSVAGPAEQGVCYYYLKRMK
jgi:hypothetical protein